MIIKNYKDAHKALAVRYKLLREIHDGKFTTTEIAYLCKNDIFFWLENFCYTFDPRPGTLRNLPFYPYDFQKDLIQKVVHSINNEKDLHIDKSRDMGVTWCILYVFQWFWQFHNGYNFHMGSKKQDNVDIIGDPSTLFGKLRYNIKLQPGWLMPEGFTARKHASLLKIVNPQNNNTITGESSNPEFSRSGRYSAVFFDEFAFWNYDYEAWSAAADSTTARLAVSTPFGKFNKFADIKFNADIAKLSLHWALHPLKDRTWYEQQKKRRTKDEIARELDINYLLSVEGRVYKDFDYATHVDASIQPVADLAIIRAWDFGLNPAVIFSQIDKNGYWQVIDEIVPDLHEKPTIAEFIPQVLEYCKENYSDFQFKDICDIAGKQRSSQTGKTDIDWLISFGIAPHYNYVRVEEGINLVASRLICKDMEPKPVFCIHPRCSITIESFAGAYKRKKSASSSSDPPPAQEHPYEDVMDCIRYTAWQYFDAHTGKRLKRRRRRTTRPDNPSTGY